MSPSCPEGPFFGSREALYFSKKEFRGKGLSIHRDEAFLRFVVNYITINLRNNICSGGFRR